MSTLHNKLTPEAEVLKEVMITGYVTLLSQVDCPKDLIRLFSKYYNEVLYWHLTKVNEINTALKTPDDEPDFITEPMHVQGIVIQYKFLSTQVMKKLWEVTA